jgi:hypothetical protein
MFNERVLFSNIIKHNMTFITRATIDHNTDTRHIALVEKGPE